MIPLSVLCIIGYSIVSSLLIAMFGELDIITQIAQLVGAAVLGAGCAVIDNRERGSQ
jgi:hypothetical protein